MAHRVILQVVVTGARVFTRAFAEAYRQANARSAYSRANPGAPGASKSHAGLTMDEACRILNVPPPKGGQTDMEHVMERFKRLFDQNDPNKGGSFYLQSKILRARERIESEVGKAGERAQAEAEKEMPKMYKDR